MTYYDTVLAFMSNYSTEFKNNLFITCRSAMTSWMKDLPFLLD